MLMSAAWFQVFQKSECSEQPLPVQCDVSEESRHPAVMQLLTSNRTFTFTCGS
jgi:hypothetical protein